jgi:RNA-directed DNA polymerase
MLKNIPMDRIVLRKWLRTGYIEQGKWYPGRKGTPQGGVISPTIANMVLDGMEEAIKASLPRRRCRVNFIRYADDFIVTAKSKTLIVKYIRPAIERFLAERGLQLSEEKTVMRNPGHADHRFRFMPSTRSGGCRPSIPISCRPFLASGSESVVDMPDLMDDIPDHWSASSGILRN